MCGICGRVDPQGVTHEVMKSMTTIMAHRGPDDEGIYVGDGVGLGSRRLSIIDLSGGHQPISNEDGTIWIVLNGEIYNYKELRSRLEGKYQFKTKSDTEVILHLYEEMGENCVRELRGMFGFAIWDSNQRKLFVARDHLGQKPIYYTHIGDQLTFGSEIKVLRAANPSLNEMDVEALHQYFTLRIIAPPRSMLKGVFKLPPGHYLTFQNGQLKIERYWHLSYTNKLQLNEAELLDALEEQMLESVRYHLVSDVPVGAFLSGGLDSSIVVSMMRKLTDQPIKTFSVGVDYEGYSELPAARITAQRCGTQHFEETIYPSLVRILPDLVWHLDEPSDPLSSVMYYISEMASREVKVILGGDGGDELFGGYDRYYGNRYVDYYALLPEPIRKYGMTQILRMMPEGFWYKSFSHKLRWLNHLSFEEGGRRYSESLSYFYFTQKYREVLYGNEMNRQLNGFDPHQSIYSYYNSNNALTAVDKMLFADSMIRLPDHSTMILDRTTMAHGLEARAPFMDHKLVEFAASIPDSFKVRGRRLRYIQTRIGERYLAPEILQRKKQGFSSALPYLLADEYRFLFNAFLSDSHLARDGYVRKEPIAQFLGEHLNRKADHGNRLWLLCNAEIWYRMTVEGWSRETMKEKLSAFGVAEEPEHAYAR